MRQIFRRLLTDERGATAVEYGLILALIFIALIVGVTSLGGSSGVMWGNIKSQAVSAMN